LYHLYKILVLLIKNWSLISWDMSEIDLPVIKLVIDYLDFLLLSQNKDFTSGLCFMSIFSQKNLLNLVDFLTKNSNLTKKNFYMPA
jgi:hypothetical protein